MINGNNFGRKMALLSLFCLTFSVVAEENFVNIRQIIHVGICSYKLEALTPPLLFVIGK